MELALIGVGGAGGSIVDEFVAADGSGEVVADSMAVDADARGIHLFQHVPGEQRVLVGEDRLRGEGTQGAIKVGAEAFREDAATVEETVESLSTAGVDAYLVVAGLGGGTGGGCAPHVARMLAERDELPVFGLPVLPSDDEGEVAELNAAMSIRSFFRYTDGLLPFDLDSFDGEDPTESVVEQYTRLFRIDRENLPPAAIVGTLRAGISTFGYASADLDPEEGEEGLLSRFTGGEESDGTEDVERLNELVRKAALGDLTLPADGSTAERVLVVAVGPSDRLPEMGVARAREWIDGKVDADRVLSGTMEIGADRVGVLTVFAGVSGGERLSRLREAARESRGEMHDDEDDLPTLVVADDSTDEVRFNEGVRVGVAVVEGSLTESVAQRTAALLREYGAELLVAAGRVEDDARGTLADHGVVVVDVEPGTEVGDVGRAIDANPVFDATSLSTDDVGFVDGVEVRTASGPVALAVRDTNGTIRATGRRPEASE